MSSLSGRVAIQFAIQLFLEVLLPQFAARADTLVTVDGNSYIGTILIEPNALVVTSANATVQRVPLTAVSVVSFTRESVSTKPAEWSGHSIGLKQAPGKFALSNGVFTVTGAGTATAMGDGHYFVQQGVGEIAQLTVFVPPQVSSRTADKFKVAGVAVLSRFDASGPAYYLCSEGGRTGLTRWRATTGKERSKHFSTTAAGVWLRLERCSEQVTAFTSEDGRTWRQVGNERLMMSDTAHMGLVVTGTKKGQEATVEFRGVELLNEAAPNALQPQLLLRDGGVLTGSFIRADGSVVRWHAAGREWAVSLVNVSRLLLDVRVSAAATRLTAGRSGALLANGDFVDGELVGGSEGRIAISSVLFGLRNYAAEGGVTAVQVREAAETAADFEVLTIDGSRLLVNQLELCAQGISGRERSAGEFQLGSAEVRELRRMKPSP